MGALFKSLLVKAIIFVCAVGGIMLLSFSTFLSAYETVGAWVSLGVYSLITIASLSVFLHYKNIESKNFLRLLLGVNGSKFFFILFFMLLYVFLTKENRLYFLISVLVQYFIFTTFELATLLRLVRSK